MSAPGGGDAPLRGLRVAVTRAPAQAVELQRRVESLGAVVACRPLIAIAPPADPAPLDAALARLDDVSWIAFTSANAVHAVADRLHAVATRVPDAVRLAAVGIATARALAARLRAADLVPDEALAATLGDALADAVRHDGAAARPVLFPCAEGARDALPERLAARGIAVRRVVAYRTVGGDGAAALAGDVRDGTVHVVLLASASAAQSLAAALDDAHAAPHDVPTLCIGPVTARAAAEAGLRVDGVAATHDTDGLVDALRRWAAERVPASAARQTDPAGDLA